MNKNMYDSATMLRIRGGVSAVGYNIENELFELVMSKVKDYFGYTIDFSDESAFIYMLNKFIKQYDRSFKYHVNGNNDNIYPNRDHYMFQIADSTFCVVKYNYTDIITSGKNKNKTSIYICGKHSPKYYRLAKKTLLGYYEELNVYYVSGAKTNKEGSPDSESFYSVMDSMTGREINTLFFEDNVKESIINHIDGFLKNKDLYQKRSLLYKTGILFYGDPGTGKTSLAKAIATKYKIDMAIINMSTFEGLNVESLTTSLNADKKMYLVLLEDIDTMFDTLDRTDTKSNRNNAVINKLLQFLDSNSSPTNVIFIATTNHPEKLDEAILRSGRFDLKVAVRGINKPKAIEMCKSFSLSDEETNKVLSEVKEYPVNQSLLQANILETINERNDANINDDDNSDKVKEDINNIYQEDKNSTTDIIAKANKKRKEKKSK